MHVNAGIPAHSGNIRVLVWSKWTFWEALMCRFLAYRGDAILLEKLVSAPTHSLIDQSLNALEARTTTNGDGFGVG